ENFHVLGLDLVGGFLDAGGVLLHGFDLLERLSPGLLLHLRMHRALATDVGYELLAFRRETETLEQPRRVRIRRLLEHAVRTDHERRTLGGIDRLDRAALLLDLENIVLVAISLHGALAERELLR